MINKLRDELLIEIAELIEKYNPEFAASVAEHLSSQEFLDRLTPVLSPKAKTSQTVMTQGTRSVEDNQCPKSSRTSSIKGDRTARKKDNPSSVGNQHPKKPRPLLLVKLEKTEPEKSAILGKFYDSLMSKKILPNLEALRTFALNIGLPPIKASSHSRAISPLIKALSPFPVEELKTKLNVVMPMATQDDRSLEGWANIILDKEQRTKRD